MAAWTDGVIDPDLGPVRTELLRAIVAGSDPGWVGNSAQQHDPHSHWHPGY